MSTILEDSDQYDPNDPKPWPGMTRAEQEAFNARHGSGRHRKTPMFRSEAEAPMSFPLIKSRKTKKRS